MIRVSSIQKKARNIIVTTSRFAKGLFSGYYRSIFKGPGMELEEVRLYHKGDEIKNVDWNVTARMGTLHTKVFREERELPVFIVIDVSASMDFGTGEGTKREWAALTAAVLSYAAVYNSDRIGAVLFTRGVEKWIKPGRGTTQAARCVKDFLEYVPENRGSDINSVLQAVYAAAVGRGICFLISDFKLAVDPVRLWRLKKRQDLVAIRVIDPAERRLESAGHVELKDLETDKTRSVYGIMDMAEHYREQGKEFRRYNIDYLDIYTNEDPLKKLYLFFKRRAQR